MCEEHGLDIPFVSVQADPVTVHPSWCDARSALTICATDEAVERTLAYGVPRERILKVGFPSRRRFTDLAQKVEKPAYDPSRPARCLLMSGGEGSGMLGSYALALMTKTDVTLTIVCGRNKQLKKRLEALLKRKYGERVRILGFVTEIENLMLESDIMIARGSPNSFFEAVVMNVPLIITGALPGQEQGNPELVERYGLGIVSEGVKRLPAAVKRLLAEDGKELARIRASQQKYRRFDNAKRIAEAARDVALRGRRPKALPQRRETLRADGKSPGVFLPEKETASTKQTWKQFFCLQGAQSFLPQGLKFVVNAPGCAAAGPAAPCRQLHSMMETSPFFRKAMSQPR